MPTEPTPPAEFSRHVLVDGLTAKGRRFAASADARERGLLARRFGLLDLARLDITGDVTSIRGGTVVRMAAHLSAEATQACVVTLAPVPQRIEVDFVRLYADEPPDEARPGVEIHLDESDDDIDPLHNGRLDVGEAAAEQLALELDPYPRAADAALDAPLADGSAHREIASARPFADLGKLSSLASAQKKRN